LIHEFFQALDELCCLITRDSLTAAEVGDNVRVFPIAAGNRGASSVKPARVPFRAIEIDCESN
jgi:hypothetical protein